MVAFILLKTLVTTLIAAQQACANPAPSTLPALLVRQASSPIDNSQIPVQCQSSCGGAIVDCGDSVDCACTDQKINQIASCFSCFTTVKDGGVDTKTAQDALDAIEDFCKAAGKPVNVATISSSPGKSGAAPIGFGSTGVFALVTLGAVVLLFA